MSGSGSVGPAPFQDLESAATEGEGSKKEARREKKEQSLRRERRERRGHREERGGYLAGRGGGGEIMVCRRGCNCKSGGPSKLPSRLRASRVNKPPHSKSAEEPGSRAIHRTRGVRWR